MTICPTVPGASNISTSTSSFEAGVQHDPNLNRLAVNMFTKTEQFLQGELDTVLVSGVIYLPIRERVQ